MSITPRLSFFRNNALALLALSLVGCSSGGDGGANNSTTTIDGSVFASSVNGATCEIYTSAEEVIGSSFTTSEDGTFSVDIPDGKLANDLFLVCQGGTYVDEVVGSTETLIVLGAYAGGGTLAEGVSFNATPGSTIVATLILDHGMTPADAEAVFEAAFGYVPDVTVAPTDATNPVPGSSLAAIQAGLRAAAFSQLTSNYGLAPGRQLDLLIALAEDLSDGIADGAVDAAQITILDTQKVLVSDPLVVFETAMDDFRTRTVTTGSYKISYDSMMMDQHGKDLFRVNITDLDDSPVTDLTNVSVMPMMYMATKTHSTPVDGQCEKAVIPGDYICTIYYVMPSEANGSSQGIWDMKVMVGGMSGAAHFYPKVMMAMGDTPVVMLRNSNLTMTMMGETKVRTFQIFKSNLTGSSGNHTLELFTSTMETMMSFPAVYTGITLNADTMTAQSIDIMGIEVSSDPTFATNVATATNSGSDGYWTASTIAGLADNSSTEKLYVRVTINGNVLNSSIDGVYVDDATTPDYGTFTVTTPKVFIK